MYVFHFFYFTYQECLKGKVLNKVIACLHFKLEHFVF